MTELLIERDEDRVDYLKERDGCGCVGVVFDKESPSYAFEMAVVRYTNDSQQIVLTLSTGGFRFQNNISIAEARHLALALNVACDEAGAA